MNKINYLILSTLFAFSISSAMAQLSVGLSGGYSYNTLDAEAGYYYTVDYKSSGGFSVGIPIEYSFAQQGFEWLSLRVEPSYITKNYTYERVFSSTIIDQQNYTNGYFDLPIMAKLGIKEGRFGGYLTAGGYIGYWAMSRTFGFYSNDLFQDYTRIYFDERVEFDSRKDNRFEAGLLLGLGLEYDINTKIGCFVEARYLYSLTDTQKSYMESNQYPRYNTTLIAQMGVMYRLGKK